MREVTSTSNKVEKKSVKSKQDMLLTQRFHEKKSSLTIKKVLKWVPSAKKFPKNIFGVSEYEIWKAKDGALV